MTFPCPSHHLPSGTPCNSFYYLGHFKNVYEQLLLLLHTDYASDLSHSYSSNHSSITWTQEIEYVLTSLYDSFFGVLFFLFLFLDICVSRLLF